jgi:hypothetical protein
MLLSERFNPISNPVLTQHYGFQVNQPKKWPFRRRFVRKNVSQNCQILIA